MMKMIDYNSEHIPDRALGKVAQGYCGVSFYGDIQELSAHLPV